VNGVEDLLAAAQGDLRFADVEADFAVLPDVEVIADGVAGGG
jgi:hypothetical protein